MFYGIFNFDKPAVSFLSDIIRSTRHYASNNNTTCRIIIARQSISNAL